MEDQDRRNSLETLLNKDNWVVWKTKDNKWTHKLQHPDFNQLLSLDKNTTEGSWGHINKGWCRRGDIRATKCKNNKTMEKIVQRRNTGWERNPDY
jgi:hypothetical protein